MKKTMIALAAGAMALAACTSAPKQETAETETAPKALVLYYSQTGTTQKVAEEIQQLTGADMATFDVQDAYPSDYNETIQRCLKEQETGEVPALAELNVNVADYDIIYLGYPIWFGTYATPVASLLKEVDFNGKTIVPFTTFGSVGRTQAQKDLQEKCPGATVMESFGIRTAHVDKAPAKVAEFLKKSGLIEGEYTQLPDFSAMADVTADDVALFKAATESYTMLKATAKQVASREIPEGTEFKFACENDTDKAPMFVYVVKSNTEGVAPDFTEVER